MERVEIPVQPTTGCTTTVQSSKQQQRIKWCTMQWSLDGVVTSKKPAQELQKKPYSMTDPPASWHKAVKQRKEQAAETRRRLDGLPPPSSTVLVAATAVSEQLAKLRTECIIRHASAHDGSEGTVVQVPDPTAVTVPDEPTVGDTDDEELAPASPARAEREVGLPVRPRALVCRPTEPRGPLD